MPVTQRPQGTQDEVIRISTDDARSAHVDDLLKRQRSMRGDSDLSRDRAGRWYYRNWFIFMVTGALAALAAWAIVEPYFDDYIYIQGPIERLQVSHSFTSRTVPGNEFGDFDVDTVGWVRINDEQIWLVTQGKLLTTGGEAEPLDITRLAVDNEIGVYLEYLEAGNSSVALGVFVVLDPPPHSDQDASMTLGQRSARSTAAAILLFPIVAAIVGLAIGAVDGAVCRLLRRALLAGVVGLLAGFIGGFVSSIIAGLIYMPLNALAMAQEGDAAAGLTTFGFLTQMGGRALAWSAAGMAMGLGQGLALRSGRLVLYGFLGGLVGGLMGGLLFDPIDILMLGVDKPSAHWSRLAGFVVIGASVGAMIGIVELLARDAWLRMTEGPLAGKEFLIFKDTMNVGASPRSDIYLFNDDAVADRHAVIRAVGDNYEIQRQSREEPLQINDRPIERARLRHGDRIRIGATTFVFQARQR